MSKAATTEALQELHSTVAKSLSTRISQDMEDGIPTDAATLGAAIKFLKDNNISADPASDDNLDDLREQFIKQREQRRKSAAQAIQLAAGDVPLQ